MADYGIALDGPEWVREAHRKLIWQGPNEIEVVDATTATLYQKRYVEKDALLTYHETKSDFFFFAPNIVIVIGDECAAIYELDETGVSAAQRMLASSEEVIGLPPAWEPAQWRKFQGTVLDIRKNWGITVLATVDTALNPLGSAAGELAVKKGETFLVPLLETDMFVPYFGVEVVATCAVGLPSPNGMLWAWAFHLPSPPNG